MRHPVILPVALSAALSAGLAAQAEPLSLTLPLDCQPGDTCFIQNYVDSDPGPGIRDYTCAGLSYDGHKGTDFGLPSIAAMQAGVDVFAAAPGRVRGTRDGVPDRLYDGKADLGGKDCGNGVVIEHAGGWETQYCHMKRGSVSVRKGQQVAAGDRLGQVGLSGRTQFPHLHISVRHDGEQIDPFRPDAAPDSCGAAEAPLWAEDLPYQPGGLMNAGFATGVPDYADVKAGTAGLDAIPANAPALVIWGFGFGTRKGDEMDLRIDGPDGPFFEHTEVLKAPKAQTYRASGKRLHAPLSPGTYTGTVVLRRDGEELSRKVVTAEIG
ncbi:M23 family metallopeptidase [Pseudooceanicola sp. C21-150M6]|uniref:M23 family metallopeptidase n=1 Tax=Pseudooceanicola sp. C21-150M6 TaxID=3434355 RepID=UPI003D7FFCC0